jgi:L-asparaginase
VVSTDPPQRTRVGVISLGGTISMLPTPGGGVAPALAAEDLLAAVPGLDSVGGRDSGTGLQVAAEDLRRLPGSALDFADVLAAYEAASRLIASGVAGVVITQGTDTIEESAYLLDLVHDGEAPLVVTGAMRSATAAGADGPANLLAALRVAASESARGLGALVVFADEVHGARFVRKAHTNSTGAFTSVPGPLGRVVEDQVRLQLRPSRSRVFPRPSGDRPLRVPVATLGLGDDGEALRARGTVADGLVLGAFGAGHVPPACVPVLEELVGRIPVVLASRTGAGPVLSTTYGFPGSESDLLGRGLISAGGLEPAKARVLLWLLLAGGSDRSAVADAFAVAGG